MTIFELNLENINELPLIDWNTKDDGLYTSVVIVPTGEIHDSGYQCMQFVFCRGTEALKRVDRGSDVLHLDGIGGYGEMLEYMGRRICPRDWAIDCTPNGYLRLFSSRYDIKVGDGLSSFDIYTTDAEGRI